MDQMEEIQEELQPTLNGTRTTMELGCYKCTRTFCVIGVDKQDAAREALRLGWAPDGDRMICPHCPAARASRPRGKR